MTIWTPVLDRSKPIYLAIADAITHDVEGGTLPSGTRLPPQRDLAWRLGVTLGTITRAYKEAEGRGLLAGEVGRGSYIRKSNQAQPLPPSVHEQSGVIDLSHAVPPPVVTATEFDDALKAVMRDARKLDLLDYAPPEGFPQQRTMAVDWLKRSAIEANARDVLISSGAHAAVTMIVGALTAPGEKVMAEQTNYALLGNVFRNAHVLPMSLAMDHDGLLPDAFEKAARTGESRLLYIVPTLQNPTTHTMSRHRRDAIVAIARKFNVTILEDDIFRLLDGRAQAPTFYSLAPERTYHVTSLSKTLAPGLRLGIVATPHGQDRILKSHARSTAARSAGLTGEIARYWIETGKADDILTRNRNELAVRREGFLETFKGHDVRCAQGAPYAWLKLPERWSANRFAALLASRNVKVTPESAFHLGGSVPGNHIRVCFGDSSPTFVTHRAFDVIRDVMAENPEDEFTPVA